MGLDGMVGWLDTGGKGVEEACKALRVGGWWSCEVRCGEVWCSEVWCDCGVVGCFAVCCRWCLNACVNQMSE